MITPSWQLRLAISVVLAHARAPAAFLRDNTRMHGIWEQMDSVLGAPR